MRTLLRRWGLFNLVGSFGFILQLLTITVLTRSYGLSTLASTAIGLEVAFLHNLLAHTCWTWRAYPLGNRRAWIVRWWRYQLAKTASLCANAGITTALVGIGHLPVEIANVVAVLACAIPNFFLAEWLVLRRRGETLEPPSARHPLHVH
jgi:putative flippase GtrA